MGKPPICRPLATFPATPRRVYRPAGTIAAGVEIAIAGGRRCRSSQSTDTGRGSGAAAAAAAADFHDRAKARWILETDACQRCSHTRLCWVFGVAVELGQNNRVEYGRKCGVGLVGATAKGTGNSQFVVRAVEYQKR